MKFISKKELAIDLTIWGLISIGNLIFNPYDHITVAIWLFIWAAIYLTLWHLWVNSHSGFKRWVEHYFES